MWVDLGTVRTLRRDSSGNLGGRQRVHARKCWWGAGCVNCARPVLGGGSSRLTMVEILGHHHGKPGGNRENKHRPNVERELLYSRPLPNASQRLIPGSRQDRMAATNRCSSQRTQQFGPHKGRLIMRARIQPPLGNNAQEWCEKIIP